MAEQTEEEIAVITPPTLQCVQRQNLLSLGFSGFNKGSFQKNNDLKHI